MLYARRLGHQSQFSPVLNAQVKGDSPFAELIGWIHSNLDAPLDVPSLAARACLSERTFHRRFVAATGESRRRWGLFPPARLTEAFERRFGLKSRLFHDMHAAL